MDVLHENCTRIKDLPNVPGVKYNEKHYDVYCYVLYFELPTRDLSKSKYPIRMFLTDFTSNPHIVNPHFPKGVDIDGHRIEDDQVLRVDVFPDKLDQLRSLYQQEKSSDFFQDVLSSYDHIYKRYIMYDKIWVIKVNISLKRYQNTIEARLKHLQSVGKADNNVALLYKNIRSIPSSFAEENKSKLRTIIPNEFQKNYSHESHTQYHDTSTSNNYNSTSNHYSQPAQTVVKSEILSDEIIPDTLFGDDYANSSPPSMELNNKRQLSSYGSIESNGKKDNSDYLLSDYYSLKVLNAIEINELDNRIYKTKGYIVGIIPRDWNLICVKSYKYNVVSNSLESLDPFVRSLEIIITDCDISEKSDQRELLLDSKNSFIIHLDATQIQRIFGNDDVESLYTRMSHLNAKYYSSNHYKPLIDLEVYKKRVAVNNGESINIWTAKGLFLADLGL